MTTHSAAKNTAGSPLVIDRAGRVLGAGAFGVITPDAQPAKGHIAAGRLILVERPTGDVELDEGALEALDAADAANAADTTPTKAPAKAAPNKEA